MRMPWIFLLVLAAVRWGHAADWPQFRGPCGTGVSSDNVPIPLQWSTNQHLAWRTQIPGLGWSQPITVGPLVFVASALTDKPQRPPDYASGTSDPFTISGGKASAPDVTLRWQVFALNLQNGAIRWERNVASGKPKYPVHPSNSYASETPVADSHAVYAWFGAPGVLAAFDHSGQPLWRKELGIFRQQNNVGSASSPRLDEGSLYLQLFNEEQAVLLCLDASNGREKWRVARPVAGSAWNTPFIWRRKEHTELLVCGQKSLTSLDPLTGSEYWRASDFDMPVIPSLSADAERVYFGYRDPIKGGPLYALGADAQGEQRLANSGKAFGNQAWNAPDAAPGMPSPLAASGCVYVLNDNVLRCLDATNGKEHYRKRLPGFRTVVASPIASRDRVLIIDEAGNAIVLQAGPTFQSLGQSRLHDRFWSSPAVANGNLLLRGLEHLYCIRE